MQMAYSGEGERMDQLMEQRLIKMREMDEAFRVLRRLINAEYNRFNVHGLGMTEGKMIIILAESGPQKASAMAEMLRITSGAVTGIADRLIQLGYIDRSRSNLDRRIVLLTITDEGRKLVGQVLDTRERIMLKLFEGFEMDEMDRTIEMFNRMTLNLETK